MTHGTLRTYVKKDVVWFRKTREDFGALSNMAADFPIVLFGVRVLTSEALYQACRFPEDPDIQRLIIEQKSPMTAKMKSKKVRMKTRGDWDDVRIDVMRWCLRTKLKMNRPRFGAVLESTGSWPIVEESAKDEFWGARPQADGTLKGMNVLGRLLMELREQNRQVKAGNATDLQYPVIAGFCLFGKSLDTCVVCGKDRCDGETGQECLFGEMRMACQASVEAKREGLAFVRP